jgi:hypothetical protein
MVVRTFVGALVALALSTSGAVAQSSGRDRVSEPNVFNFHDRILSIQATDTAEGSPALYVTFADPQLGVMHVGRGASDGAFAAMSSIILTAIQMDCPVSGFRQAEVRRNREVSWRLNWVQLDAHECRRSH